VRNPIFGKIGFLWRSFLSTEYEIIQHFQEPKMLGFAMAKPILH